ncbi:MAG: NAD(P)/FAD-dependent oxidoreductase [bacterium]|nr:NAD(P)/FAD-dependent oxidoreductase [bacterium]
MLNGYDIAVIGAGPAGSMAAITAAKEGCKVVLIEEHPDIGIPFACGEAISKDWLLKFVTPKSSWLASEINGVVFYSPSYRSFRVTYPDVGYILERKLFDRDLTAIAADAGCDVKVNTKAISLISNGIKTSKGDILTKIIVGADGKRSMIARWAGINSRLELKDFWIAHEYLLGGINVDQELVEIIVGKEIAPGGYGWVFPKGKGLANVGLEVAPILTKKSPKLFLNKFIEWRFKKYSILGEYRSIIPCKYLSKLVKGRVCIVGDAARFVDPISGGGIGNALLSGKLAGKNCAIAIKNDDITKLKQYEREWETVEGSNFKFKLRVRNILMKLNDSDLELIFDFGAKNFGGKTINKINDREIIRNIVTSSPGLLKLGLHLLK